MCSWPLALSSEQSYAGIFSAGRDCSGQAAKESWKTRTKARPEGAVNEEGPVYRLSQGPVLRAVSMETARTCDLSLLTEKMETVLLL